MIKVRMNFGSLLSSFEGSQVVYDLFALQVHTSGHRHLCGLPVSVRNRLYDGSTFDHGARHIIWRCCKMVTVGKRHGVCAERS
jgi:hypothetical protein